MAGIRLSAWQSAMCEAGERVAISEAIGETVHPSVYVALASACHQQFEPQRKGLEEIFI